MSQTEVSSEIKRPINQENNPETEEPPKKILKSDLNLPFKKKNFALLLAYCGKDYYGLQINKGYKTIEGELFEAMIKAGVVREDHVENNAMRFQRAARTDKGVSAAANVVNAKMFSDVDNPVEKLNENLPSEIRVLAMRRVTKGFNCKNNCDSRTYTYLIPTHAFSPKDDSIDPSSFRIDKDAMSKVEECLQKFVGVHNFHNFTSGKKFRDPSAKRNILSFKMLEPFVRENMEFSELRVKGQSFMMHHIRKMIGLTIAIVKGYTTVDLIDKCWQAGKVDVPKAPGLGLWLETLHYDMYNKRFAKSHESLEWAEYQEDIANFKKNYIYPTIIECESKERPMIDWLNTLPIHNYDEIVREKIENTEEGKIEDKIVNNEETKEVEVEKKE